jgi:hypothetical protein
MKKSCDAERARIIIAIPAVPLALFSVCSFALPSVSSRPILNRFRQRQTTPV